MESNKVSLGMEMFDKYMDKSGLEKKIYQYDGVKWLLQNELREKGVRGGFVADEMGLGKTITMIGLCLANFMHKTLIVLPPVLIDQWFAQIYRTTGHKCVIYHGENKKHINSIGLVGLEKAVIVLCSYDAITITRENKKKKTSENNGMNKKNIENSLLHKMKWGRIIFDEAHHLRNKNTNRYFGAKLLNAEVKWLVSGTPVQNKKNDFYALCSLINLSASYYTDKSNLIEIARNHILKRTKKQVGVDLDDAVENKKIVDWKNMDELKLSEKIHSSINHLHIKMSEAKEKNDARAVRLGRYELLTLLLRARQTCIYPKMIGNNFDMDMKDINKVEAMKSTSKLDTVVAAILERKDNENGKLVFCHFKEEISEIAQRLRGEGLLVGVLDGKTNKGARAKMLTEKKDVLIMQIQTGCEGLNLQENYSEIYFVSPHWNPYVEDQAVGRCHRIGQKKSVFVWRFEMNHFDLSACVKNLDKHVTEIQNNKRDMVSKVI
jgi:SNF2 family DNA or RNA helicase